MSSRTRVTATFTWRRAIQTSEDSIFGRISVFDRNGKFLRVIGKRGTGPGQFDTARARVRLSGTADRRRPPQPRIQILTKEGILVNGQRVA